MKPIFNFNFVVKDTSDDALHAVAQAAATLRDALKAQGFDTVQAVIPPAINPAIANASEKGEYEMALLAKTGKSRMLVPATWTGTREEWAFDKLINEAAPAPRSTSASHEDEDESEVDLDKVF